MVTVSSICKHICVTFSNIVFLRLTNKYTTMSKILQPTTFTQKLIMSLFSKFSSFLTSKCLCVAADNIKSNHECSLKIFFKCQTLFITRSSPINDHTDIPRVSLFCFPKSVSALLTTFSEVIGVTFGTYPMTERKDRAIYTPEERRKLNTKG